jgi:hypothetical protein
MATLNSTTTTMTGIFLSKKTTEPGTGNANRQRRVIVPSRQFTDNSVTPKENDWLVDGNGASWLVDEIKEDPILATYTITLRKM